MDRSAQEQQLWEYVYDLLPDTEAQELVRRIGSDPDLARAYAEVKLQSELLAEAARLEEPPVELARHVRLQGERAGGLFDRAALLLNGLVVVAATLLIGLVVYPLVKPDSPLRGSAVAQAERRLLADHASTLVVGPARLQSGVPQQFNVTTRSLDGGPASQPLLWRLVDQQGQTRLESQLRTDDQGRGTITLDPVFVSSELRLEVETGEAGRGKLVHKLETERARYTTWLSLDKPLYRPGESVYFRSLTLGRFSLADRNDLLVEYELLDPSQAPLAGSQSRGLTQGGVGNGQLPLPPGLPGGRYTLVARSPTGLFDEVRREFFVRDYRAPRLKKQLEFTRDSYSQGDQVQADLLVERAEGGPLGATRLQVLVIVDGQPVALPEETWETDATGACRIHFTLPGAMQQGAGVLSVAVDDGGTVETIAKTIPINLGKVVVDFYPEGGFLVPGVPQRVYFHARDPLGEPVDVEGSVVAADGTEVAELATTHEGRGKFEFTPTAGAAYRLRIERPVGVDEPVELPVAGDDAWLALRTAAGVLEPDEPLRVELVSRRAEAALVVAAVCREVTVGQAPVRFDAKSGEDESKSRPTLVDGSKTRPADEVVRRSVELPLADEVGGVIRVTVYDYGQQPPRPLAERLVFRRSARQLNVELAEDAREYAPGQPVKLTVQVRDERGEGVAAALGLAVSDQSVVRLADEKLPGLLTQVRLMADLQNAEKLEDANFFLSDDPLAPEALDLLLATQGWRTFVDAPAPAPGMMPGTEPGAELDGLAAAGQESATAEAPVLFSNEQLVRAALRDAVQKFQLGRQAELSQLGLWIVALGLGVLTLLAVLGLLRMSVRRHVWLPAVLVSGACLLVGLSWMSARVTSRGQLVMGPVLPAATARLVALVDSSESLESAEYPSVWGLNLPATASAQSGPEQNGRLLGLEAATGMLPNLALSQLDMSLNGNLPPHFEGFFPPGMGPGMPGMAGMPGMDGGMMGAGGAMGMGGPGGWLEARGYRFGVGNMDIAGFGGMAQQGMGEMPGMPGMGMGPAAGDMPVMPGMQGFGMPLGGPGPAVLYDFEVPVDGARREQFLGDLFHLQAAGQNEEARRSWEEQLRQMRFVVRSYAHQPPPRSADQPRQDFQETLFWHPLLLTDATGQASVEFQVSDLVTTFEVRAEAHGQARLGEARGRIVSRLPFSLEPKLPLEVTEGDRIDLPVAVNNDTDEPLEGRLRLETDPALRLSGPAELPWQLAAGERGRLYFPLEVVQVQDAEVRVHGSAGPLSDQVRRPLRIVPAGFPVAEALAGTLEGRRKVTVQLPEQVVPGTLQVTLRAFPSPLADLRRGIEGLLREPSGCFEQTSSSNYPNVMALWFMQEHKVADPEFTRRARQLLGDGYGKLTGFECPQRGYEWFGGDPGHEALTAYGLMQFRDMRQVWDVDQAMVQRTTEWLMRRRDGQGGFLRNPQALDSFGAAPAEVTDAYIVWALSEAGQQDVRPELDHALELARQTEDPYVVALAAIAVWNLRPGDAAVEELTALLVELQAAEGHLEGKLGTITRSGGLAQRVETTSLAALAWLKSGQQPQAVRQALQWLVENRDASGTFGSTQATILALKALIEDARQNRRDVATGELVVERDGQPLARAAVREGQMQVVEITGLEEHLAGGENPLVLELTGEGQMPYLIDIQYRSPRPISHPDCKLQLQTRLATDKIRAGDTVKLHVQLANDSGADQPMTVAIVGLPAGLEPRVERLDELREAGSFDFYEIRGRELVFYWRGLSDKSHGERAIKFEIDLLAEIPGTYTGPASRAYLYYTGEQKTWVEPLRVEIARP
ncbi:MAG: hypothetical protein J5I93_22565 [Pirellulaceae bacterium]|nr:hypothetical protein [Pirellulaceae bacterium]